MLYLTFLKQTLLAGDFLNCTALNTFIPAMKMFLQKQLF